MTTLEARQLERTSTQIKRETAEKRFIQLTYRGQQYEKVVSQA